MEKFIHRLKLFFANDKKLRRLMRLYWAEQLVAGLMNRVIKLHKWLKFKRKGAFKEWIKKNKEMRAIYNNFVGRAE